MNPLKYILLFVIILFYSCEDKLDLAPESSNSAANFYQSEQDLEQALIGAYDALQSNGQYGLNFIYFMEVRSDNSYSRSITNSGGVFGDVELFRMQPTNPLVDQSWESCYKGIQRCNTLINRATQIDLEENFQSRILGEAKFIRALTYFNMVRLWGDVPLLIEEVTDPFAFFDITRTSATEVYQQIERDLQEAILELPENNIAGRATKTAAQTLLGKVMLTQKKYAESKGQFEAVINSNRYILLDSYADIFKTNNENNKESIFEIQYLGGGLGEGSAFANNMAIDPSQIGNMGSVSGDNMPSVYIVEQYDDSDLRKTVNIGFFNNSPYCNKYIEIPSQNADGDKNFIVLRYADVLLSYAEALNEIDFQSEGVALDALNQIRSRAGLPTYQSGDIPNKERFREAIEKERQLELAFENHRWFDLIRTGRALEVMNQHILKTGQMGNIQARQLLYPIPQSQIDASGNAITQNEGY